MVTILNDGLVAHSSTLAARCLSLVARQDQQRKTVADLGLEPSIAQPTADPTLLVAIDAVLDLAEAGLADGRVIADVATEAIRAVAATAGAPIEDVWWKPLSELSERPMGLLIRSAARIRMISPASSMDVAAAGEVLRYISRAVMPKAGVDGLVVAAINNKIKNYLLEYGQSPKRGSMVTDSAEAVYRLIVHAIAGEFGLNPGEIGPRTTFRIFGDDLPARRHATIQVIRYMSYATDPNWTNK